MVTAWLRGFADTDLPLLRLIRDRLHGYIAESDEAPFGIVILRAPAGGSLPQIRMLADRARVIVLLAPDARLSLETKWSLLAAGAADVLDWPGNDQLTECIVPRLSRWAEIETLVADNRVRASVIGESSAWRDLLRQATEIAAFSDAGLLLTGETGTGKEQIARLVHMLDRRPRKTELVVVDCTTLSRELMGSELFGHERGAFTGAVAAHDGALAVAHRGTLFLDEIGELELSLQAQLLRVIQEHSFKRIGSNVWQKTDFRLICATNRDLERDVDAGRFRADLYYRVADHSLRLPPLRDRREDILPLAAHFWRSAGDGVDPDFDETLQRFLVTRHYPGNVRDLRRIVLALRSRHPGGGSVSVGAVPQSERPALAGAEGGGQAPEPVLSSDPWHSPGFIGAIEAAIADGIGFRDIGRAASSTAIRIALEQEGGNLQRAARRLGVTDRALQMRRANGEE
ncbi:MAG: sigma-54-dependent transcriptional regulator [Stellaceae bacterium]